MQHEITKNNDSTIDIKVSIPWEMLVEEKPHALAELGQNVEVDGFRKGNAPKELVEKNIKPAILLEVMAEYAVNKAYINILESDKIDAIGRPEVFFTKIAEGNALECTIKTSVLPTFELPKYKALAKEIKKDDTVKTTDEELEKTMQELREMRAHQKLHTPVEEGGHGHDHDDHSHAPIEEKDLPEVNEEFAKSFGFDTVEKLKEKIAENMEKEKENRAHEKFRIEIMEKLVSNTEIAIPPVLIESETDMLIERMKHDISQMGLSFDDYMKHLAKDEVTMREEFKKDAEKRIKSKLIIDRIAKEEKITPEQEEVNTKVSEIMKQYADADKFRAEAYVTELLTTEKVFEFLTK
jgi:FKBP-type peptidyl-prolyl cis-trans isomerase (trigger factor)